ncbi:MAG: ABC transporter ATP-binding protein [Deltaproteobacteria bacterium]|nr:ABC transporter ATP-binding protein [Deltaproteobacteria bacterium]
MSETLSLTGLAIRGPNRLLVENVSLSLAAGRVTALVGPSGSGKTLTARALLGLVGFKPGVISGTLEAGGAHLALTHATPQDYRPLRGKLLGYLPQGARASLDPLWTVERSVGASAALGSGPNDPSHWLRLSGFDDPEQVLRHFPHELSGGMAQRAALACALAGGSRFLIADEPTTGLDPTVQEGILRHLTRLKARGLGVLLITHDLRLLPELADEVLVMAAGRIEERVTPEALVAGALRSEAGVRLLEATRTIASGRLG